LENQRGGSEKLGNLRPELMVFTSLDEVPAMLAVLEMDGIRYQTQARRLVSSSTRDWIGGVHTVVSFSQSAVCENGPLIWSQLILTL
jgi:hypothetical protein